MTYVFRVARRQRENQSHGLGQTGSGVCPGAVACFVVVVVCLSVGVGVGVGVRGDVVEGYRALGRVPGQQGVVVFKDGLECLEFVALVLLDVSR